MNLLIPPVKPKKFNSILGHLASYNHYQPPLTTHPSAAMSFPKIYTTNGPSSTSAASLPSWITIKTKPTRTAQGQRKRVKTQHQLGSLELIQDFAFPGSGIKIKSTEDGEHVMATGTYKPMIKVWELDQLAVKFERVTEAENVDFVVSPLTHSSGE